MQTSSGFAGGAPRSERFIAGDSIRGLACLVVVFWHVVANAASFTPPAGVSHFYVRELGLIGRPIFFGAMFVWLFFVLSGYLISGPFVRAVVRGDGRSPRLTAYTRNRVLRIVPAFWLFLTITILVFGTSGNSLRQMAAFYAFGHVYNQGPFTHHMIQAWTLDVEVVFYAAVPLLLLPAAALLRGRWTPRIRAALILAGCLVVAVASLMVHQRGPHSGLIVPASMWSFVPGIALATIEPFVRPRLAGRHLGRVLARVLLVVALAGFLADNYVVPYGNDPLQKLGSMIACGSFVAAALVLQWSSGGSWRWLHNRFFSWVGVRSYGLYLVHVIVLQKLVHLTASFGSTALAVLIVFPLVLLASMAVGGLSYEFVELPFLERRAPWRSPAPKPAPAPSVAVATAPAATQ